MNIETSEFMNAIQAAQFLGVAPGTLAVWRCKSRYKLPYIKCGRLIRYRPDDLRKWAESRAHVGVDLPKGNATAGE